MAFNSAAFIRFETYYNLLLFEMQVSLIAESPFCAMLGHVVPIPPARRHV